MRHQASPTRFFLLDSRVPGLSSPSLGCLRCVLFTLQKTTCTSSSTRPYRGRSGHVHLPFPLILSLSRSASTLPPSTLHHGYSMLSPSSERGDGAGVGASSRTARSHSLSTTSCPVLTGWKASRVAAISLAGTAMLPAKTNTAAPPARKQHQTTSTPPGLGVVSQISALLPIRSSPALEERLLRWLDALARPGLVAYVAEFAWGWSYVLPDITPARRACCRTSSSTANSVALFFSSITSPKSYMKIWHRFS